MHGGMSDLEIVLVAIGLAMDAFAVSLAAGTAGRAGTPRAVFRLSFHFGLFQFMMPVIGWYAGTKVTRYVGAFDHWIAFGLLVFVGGRMVLSGLGKGMKESARDPSRGWALVMLSLATSVDALAVGLSLAVLEVGIWYPAVLIGVITAGLCVVGIALGNRLGLLVGRRMEAAGGVLLILIGIRILVGHLTAVPLP
jgi:putative Mn2+ efflux pump MntP